MYKYLSNFSKKNSLKVFVFNKSNYHSEKGVFGYIHREPIQESIPTAILDKRTQHSNIFRWVDAYRTHGHRLAKTNPVEFFPKQFKIDELNPSNYGLTENDKCDLNGIVYNVDSAEKSVTEIEKILQNIYCSESISAEFNFIENIYEREWVAEQYEKIIGQEVDRKILQEIGELLIQSQAWDKFLATKFPTVKRYGGEGAESMLGFFHQIFNVSAENDIQNIVLGMPHRGKLNLLVTMLNTRPAKIFRKLKGKPEFPSDAEAMCDIASHFNASTDILRNGKKIHLSMLHNPSHLESVNPVSMGKTLSKQQSNEKTINLILHGDAAFPGQGINQECLLMSGLPNFDVGGTIHMVVNNQVGFTTPGDRGRVTNYSTDLAKTINAPIFHVNGDHPEMLYLITKLAFDYNQKFQKDVFIDYHCFRRWGHNELDDPTFTNPALYKIIHNRDSIPDAYCKRLIEKKIFSENDVKLIGDNFTDYLTNDLKNWEDYQPEKSYFQKQWEGIVQSSNSISVWNTGLDYSLLNYIGKYSVQYPDDFNIHPHLLKTHVKNRLKKLESGHAIDWATAESLAFGSLMYQGHNVRISGEDVGRGTFSHRHAMLVDQETNSIFIPLNSMAGGLGGKLEIANSILSEEAVLGFEYGMSIDNPKNLIIWEAQFGDFFNGAQIIFDTFISSGETKWMICNSLVILLPHGFDGAASEHSSCRIERFLQMTDSKETKPDGDNVNFNVINPTTPAQYFHALRRQMVRNFRKPLIVVSPKTLLRLSEATSTHTDFEPGTSFHPVLGDNDCEPKDVTKLIFCSGKHYYNLKNERSSRNLKNVAIIRIESLCPFPCNEIQMEMDKYKSVKDFIWSQEEPRNMGAWSFIKPRFENLLGRRIKYCGRNEAGTIAVGVSAWHNNEVEHVVQCPFQ